MPSPSKDWSCRTHSVHALSVWVTPDNTASGPPRDRHRIRPVSGQTQNQARLGTDTESGPPRERASDPPRDRSSGPPRDRHIIRPASGESVRPASGQIVRPASGQTAPKATHNQLAQMPGQGRDVFKRNGRTGSNLSAKVLPCSRLRGRPFSGQRALLVRGS